MGWYSLQTDKFGEKSVYVGGSQNLYFKEDFGWMFSAQELGSDSNGGIMSEEDTICPNEAAEWKYYDRFNSTCCYDKVDDTFNIECKDCRSTVGTPCVFPFVDDGKEYNACANWGGSYYYCPTSVGDNKEATTWQRCPSDGTCPLDQQSGTTTVTVPTSTTVALQEMCKTKPIEDGDDPKPTGANKPCIMGKNIKIKGKKAVFKDCFKIQDYGDKFICATQVNGKNFMKKFGYCNDVCLKQMCLTEEDDKCIFPFKYKNKKYNQCFQSPDHDNKYVCATRVQKGSNSMKKWGECGISCFKPVVSTFCTEIAENYMES